MQRACGSLQSRIRRWSHFAARGHPVCRRTLGHHPSSRSTAEPVVPHRLRLKAVQDDCSRRPSLADRQLEVAGPVLGTERLTMLCVGQSVFECPVFGAKEVDCTIAGSQVEPVAGARRHRACQGSRHPGWTSHVRTGAPSVERTPRPPPPVLGRANLGRAKNGAFLVHSGDMKTSWARNRICRRLETGRALERQERRSNR
jgi:hypothetical protein